MEEAGQCRGFESHHPPIQVEMGEGRRTPIPLALSFFVADPVVLAILPMRHIPGHANRNTYLRVLPSLACVASHTRPPSTISARHSPTAQHTALTFGLGEPASAGAKGVAVAVGVAVGVAEGDAVGNKVGGAVAACAGWSAAVGATGLPVGGCSTGTVGKRLGTGGPTPDLSVSVGARLSTTASLRKTSWLLPVIDTSPPRTTSPGKGDVIMDEATTLWVARPVQAAPYATAAINTPIIALRIRTSHTNLLHKQPL